MHGASSRLRAAHISTRVRCRSWAFASCSRNSKGHRRSSSECDTRSRKSRGDDIKENVAASDLSSSSWEQPDPRLEAISLLRKFLRAVRQLQDETTRLYLRTYIWDQYRRNIHVDGHTIRRGIHSLWDLKNAGRARTLVHPLHIYRHHLRAVSYLPGEEIRAYHRNYARQAFRKQLYDYQGHPNVFPEPKEFQYQVSQARKDIRQLERAGHGNIHNLHIVFMHAYGRKGPRRHQLMGALKGHGPWPDRPAPGIREHDIITEALRDFDHITPEAWQQIPRFTVAAQALMLSHQKHNRNFVGLPRKHSIKSFSISIPTKNLWGRPTPVNRIKNSAQKQYAWFLDKMLPPVPVDEWQRLQDLAYARIACSIPSRRISVSRNNTSEVTRALERTLEMSTRPSLNLEQANHGLSQRLIQHMYARIFLYTAKMELVGTVAPGMKMSQKVACFKITWGHHVRSFAKLPLDSLNAQNIDDSIARELFDIGPPNK